MRWSVPAAAENLRSCACCTSRTTTPAVRCFLTASTSARALLKQSSILLADEATAALDAQTAHEITQDILSLTGITRVVVTHRLEASLLECYDEILVLKDGRIAETGTFAELVQRGGYFSAMYKVAH